MPDNFFLFKRNISNAEIVEYYGQIYDNVKHLKNLMGNVVIMAPINP